jgi:hypothetical protein
MNAFDEESSERECIDVPNSVSFLYTY